MKAGEDNTGRRIVGKHAGSESRAEQKEENERKKENHGECEEKGGLREQGVKVKLDDRKQSEDRE